MTQRLHIYYSGRVQGVGFRYTAQRSAVSLGLAGWVKNMDDGRVEVVLEGADEALKVFMEKMKGSFKGYIQDVDVEWSCATGEFREFEVRF